MSEKVQTSARCVPIQSGLCIYTDYSCLHTNHGHHAVYYKLICGGSDSVELAETAWYPCYTPDTTYVPFNGCPFSCRYIPWQH